VTRKPPPPPTARISVNLTRKAADDIDRLIDATGMNKTDLVNRAIQLYALVHDETTAGSELHVTRTNGQRYILALL
jgi:metal-responsive CopG/Arc/MetJ family transcriptional regulator